MKKVNSAVVDIKKISDYIASENITVEEFCKRCNFSMALFKKIIIGQDFKIINLLSIARIMKVDVSDILQTKCK